MFKRANKVKISSQKNKNFKQERSVNKTKKEIANNIIEQTKGILEDPVEDKDSIAGLGDTIKSIIQPILDKFKDLISENKDKKSFIEGLIKIFMILSSSRSTTLAKS